MDNSTMGNNHMKNNRQNYNEELKQEQILDIFSRFSHDIKNMLSTMYSSYQLAELRIPNLKELAVWNRFRQTIRSMNTYVDRTSLLRYSYNADITTFDLRDLIFQLPDLCDERFNDAEREFDFDVPATELIISADKDTLTSALMEILANCYEATKEHDIIKITVTDSYRNFFITISDSGCGIERSELDTAFAPYTTNKPEHLGIGLTIAQNVIAAHKGTIEIDTNSEGTTIRIELPYNIT